VLRPLKPNSFARGLAIKPCLHWRSTRQTVKPSQGARPNDRPRTGPVPGVAVLAAWAADFASCSLWPDPGARNQCLPAI